MRMKRDVKTDPRELVRPPGQRTHEYLGYALNVLLARIHGCAPVGCRTPVCTFFPLKHKSVSIFPKAVAAAFR